MNPTNPYQQYGPRTPRRPPPVLPPPGPAPVLGAAQGCDCCAGVDTLTPASTANAPGLGVGALFGRVGTHGTFLATMRARLSDPSGPGRVPAGETATGIDGTSGDDADDRFPLARLTTRSADDPAIALLDGWAMVADVLAFYNERIVNEGYLRTAIHRRSLVELARLVGYRPRPGVASSVHLAFTLDAPAAAPGAVPAILGVVIPGVAPMAPTTPDASVPPPAGGGAADEVVVPLGTLARSQPGQGESPEPFETAEDLKVRPAWNALQPRMTRPQDLNALPAVPIYFQGTATGLKANDPLLIEDVSPSAKQTKAQPLPVEHPALRLFRVRRVTPDAIGARTRVDLEQWQIDQSFIQLMARSTDPVAMGWQPEYLATLPATAGKIVDVIRTGLGGKRTSLGGTTQGAVESLDELIETLRSMLHAVPDPDRTPEFAAWARNVLDRMQSLRAALRTPEAPGDTDPSPFAGPAGAPGPVGWDHILNRLLPANAAGRRGGSLPDRGFGAFSNAVATGGRKDKVGQRSATPDLSAALLGAMRPEVAREFYQAWRNVRTAPQQFTAYAFRVRAQPFGHNAPQRTVVHTGRGEDRETVSRVTYEEWDFTDTAVPIGPGGSVTEISSVIALAGSHPQVRANDRLVIDRPKGKHKDLKDVPLLCIARDVSESTKASYGMAGPVTSVELDKDWLRVVGPDEDVFGDVIRQTVVHAQPEALALAEEPIDEPVCGERIELPGLFDGLESGRWLIVAGERTADDAGVPGVRGAELVMLARVEHRPDPASQPSPQPVGTSPPAPALGPANPALGQPQAPAVADPALPGDTPHTHLIVSPKLAHCYVRGSVTIFGNVVRATHGETRREVLGGGDASRPLLTFQLKQRPLTHLPAPTPAGAESTLRVRVNGVLWHEADDLFGLGPNDRVHLTAIGDDGAVSVKFGNGRAGARPPTGMENIRAEYRVGIGRGGNVRAGQVSVLGAKPLGVKEVTNPLPAAGGADREGTDAIRRNAPLGVTALGRLVSVVDYADFARAFAGIAKAASARLSDGRNLLVHLTVAGLGDAPIPVGSDLLANLAAALRRFGDPAQPVRVSPRRLLLLILEAGVRVAPDHLWEQVEPRIRAALLDRFGFDRQDLGQAVSLSAVVAVIQAVAGVEYVDVDAFGAVSDADERGVPATPDGIVRQIGEMLQRTKEAGRPDDVVRAGLAREVVVDGRTRILAAEVACFAPAVPDTLILKEIGP